MKKLFLMLAGSALVLMLALRLDDDLDCTGVPEGGECSWSASSDFWVFLVCGLVAVAIAVLPRARVTVRLAVAAAVFMAGVAIFFY